MADTGTEDRVQKMEVDYSSTVDEKVPKCEKLAKVYSLLILRRPCQIMFTQFIHVRIPWKNCHVILHINGWVGYQLVPVFFCHVAHVCIYSVYIISHGRLAPVLTVVTVNVVSWFPPLSEWN